MAKVYRRSRLKAASILARADKLETRANDPKDRDHPDWLRGRVKGMRKYALKKAKARVRRADDRRKESRKEKT